MTRPERPLVIGIGNRFRRDDGVAAEVLERLAASPQGDVDLLELDGEPTRVVDAWDGRDHVVVVDAVADPRRVAGEVVTVDGADTASLARWSSGVSGHAAGLSEALRLAEVLGRLPGELTVVGVVGGDFGDGPGLSDPVQRSVGDAVRSVRGALGEVPSRSEVPGVPR